MRTGPLGSSGRGSKASASAADDVEPAGIMRGDLLQRGDRALVALDRDDACGAERQQRAGQSARPGADLEHGDAGERTGRARDAGGQIEIEQKILSERFLGGEAVAANDLAQRRQAVRRGRPAAARSRRGRERGLRRRRAAPPAAARR